jgi:hypothetical protein
VSDGAELLAVVQAAIEAFRALGIPYFITGSFASSVHGEFRATNDLDVVADLDGPRARRLVEALSTHFLTDGEQATAALASGTNFNVIHRETFLKVDVFPCRSAFDREATQRAESITLPQTTVPLRVATKEDILLAKLRWYRLGDETSEVQRRDVGRLVDLNRGEFDEAYLRRWAARLDVLDLLEEFLRQGS